MKHEERLNLLSNRTKFIYELNRSCGDVTSTRGAHSHFGAQGCAGAVTFEHRAQICTSPVTIR